MEEICNDKGVKVGLLLGIGVEMSCKQHKGYERWKDVCTSDISLSVAPTFNPLITRSYKYWNGTSIMFDVLIYGRYGVCGVEGMIKS